MAMTAGEIKSLIEKGIPGATVEITDLRGDGDHYMAYIVSAAFEGKSRVEQHRMVYEALEGRMGPQLHALAIQTATPEAAS